MAQETDQTEQPSPLTRLNRATAPVDAGLSSASVEQGVTALIACLTARAPDEHAEDRTASFNPFVAHTLGQRPQDHEN